MVKQYGDWIQTKGNIEELADVIEEAKQMMYENAEESLRSIGVDIKDVEIEWVIHQVYRDLFGRISKDPFDGAIPYVTIAWKTEVETDEGSS